jgi:hypothetical protein
MNAPATFARRVFFWSGIYGLVLLLPLYFMEDLLGRAAPPAFNRPEQFYGFVGVAVAWQLAYLLIAKDVERYRPFMLPAVAGKFLCAGAVFLLFANGRVAVATAVPALMDYLLGCLFFFVYLRCSSAPPNWISTMTRHPTTAQATGNS